MTYDNTNQTLIAYRTGEKRPIYGTISGLSGTETVTNPTFTLENSLGTKLLDAVPAQASAPGLSTQVFYNLDTTGYPAGAWYYGYFDAPNVASADSIPRKLRPTLAIWIAPIIEATYVPGTPLGRLRAAIADTNVPDAVWSDDELVDFLDANGGNVNVAAHRALLAQASDRAKIAVSINSGGWGTSQAEVYRALMELAQQYRTITAGKVYVPQTEALFTMGNTELGTVGTMDKW